MRHSLISAAFAGALLAGAGAATAHAGTTAQPPAPAGAEACGYWQTSADAWYNHCAKDTRVVINVDVKWASDYTKCVGPGNTYLGSTSSIRGAWYVGRTC
ncbi:DUF6355 family natural product biosynthesis protein [Streptomyces sp. TRM 70351]|uniref:DUF6355 family natural product biosynthesis protein n=1 Tax=Streptomyces sp. TRM 70351 TaxID=3116552 RepID=UPI002E7BD597|nr:DUF6355 family natural product biosynthesis protein [Streptomyces sp. TRM 70351]MEE1929630.1 DUF6355 family natural product biosynthesis protein [Streptomyces sp. TRM 70351]